MKKIITSIYAIALALMCSAFQLPTVSDSTEPCVWTRNITGVRAAAKTTGYPMLVLVINDSNGGEGCTHCKAFLEKNRAGIEKLAKTYKFYMVLLNYWSGANGYSTYAKTYRVDFGVYPILPSVCVRKPDGTVSDGWGYPLTDKDITDRIQTEIEKYAIAKSTFSLSASSTSVAMGATWTGKITRTGDSKKTGTVAVSLSGSAAADYTVDPASIDWDASDGTKTITVKGPSAGTELRSDAITVAITADGFTDSNITYGTQKLTVNFKDSRVSKTIEEFKSENKYFSDLAASSVWYVPSDGAGALVSAALAANAKSTLTWTAPQDGTLEIAGKLPSSGSLTLTVSGADQELTSTKVSAELSKGDKVVVTAQASDALDNGAIGLATLAFTQKNVAPEFAEGTVSSVTAYKKLESYVSVVAVSDSGSVKYSSKGLPSGMKVTTKGILKGTPSKSGTFTANIIASNAYGATTQAVTITVGNFPSKFKGKYSGIVFDGAENMVAGVSWKMSSSGKWTVTVERNGKKTKIKGETVIDANGNPVIDGDGVYADIDAATSIWTGKWSGLTFYAKKVDGAVGSRWTGVWNAGLLQSPAGYLTAKIASKGKVAVTGKVSGKTKIKAKDQLLVLNGAFVAANLTGWAASDGGDVAFVRSRKKSSGKIFDGGIAFYADGSIGGKFTFAGATYDSLLGSKWNTNQSLASLDGAVLTLGDLASVPVEATDKKLSAGENKCSAKLSGKKKTGIFKGSFKVSGKKAKYEGILFRLDGALKGIGGGIIGSAPFAVDLGAADDE